MGAEHGFTPAGGDYPAYLYCADCGASESGHREPTRATCVRFGRLAIGARCFASVLNLRAGLPEEPRVAFVKTSPRKARPDDGGGWRTVSVKPSMGVIVEVA